MTRHRRNDPEDMDGDAPWRAPDYDQEPAPPGAGDYDAPWGGPAAGSPRSAGGAFGTSIGGDDRPGEATAPPWELPGWNEAVPAPRRPRDDSAHPSGPLPQVNSGPMPRLPAETWPPATSGPQAAVPREPWPVGSSRYPAARHGGGFGDQDDTGYLRTGSGYGGDRSGSGEHPSHGGGSGYPGDDADYDDPGHGGSFPSRGDGRGDRGRGGYPGGGGDYPGGDYDEPGYHDEADYPAQRGYPGGSGHPGGGGYPGGDDPGRGGYNEQNYGRGDDYPGHDDYADETGYADEPGYPGQDGYPDGHDDGYPDDGGYRSADDYPSGRGQRQPQADPYGRQLPDDPDDHGYGDRGGWYGDVDEDRAWGDDEDDSGMLPGFGDEGDFRRGGGRGSAPARPARAGRSAPPSRPRGGKPKKRKSAMRRAAPWIALTVLVVVLAVAGAGFLYVWHNYLHPPDYSGSGTGTVEVHIQQGETAAQVGEQLQTMGVVASARAFSNAAKASGKGSSLQPGYYTVHKHMAAALAFAMLLKSSSKVQYKVVIIEGERLSEIIANLGKQTGDLKGYQQAIKDVSALGLPSYANGNPEGYLFPATYTIQRGMPPIQVLRSMVQAFDNEAQSAHLSAMAAHDHISERDAIIVASLIQAEGKRPKDLPKIARVIYNRLNQHMKLQLDTTVLYARASRAADVSIAQTRDTKSAYNTYLHAGLPPGPIDSPGDLAIKAALHPAPTTDNWVYFLTVNPNSGLTKFTNSYTVFQQYVAELNNYNATHH